MHEKTSLLDLKDMFKQYFKIDINYVIDNEQYYIFNVNGSRLRDFALFLKERDGNLINISILDFKNDLQLIYEFNFRQSKAMKFLFLLFSIENNSIINPIKDIYPQAKYYEQEIEKRFGVIFKHLSDQKETEPFTIPIPFELQKYTNNYIPFGIFNRNSNIKNYINLLIKRNKIISVAEKTGWSYRGIIPLLTSFSFKENIKLTKRICYPSSYHHNLSYIMSLEQLFEIKVQNRVKQIRTAFCELERFECILLWFINLFDLLKIKNTCNILIDLRKKFQISIKRFLKIRFFDDCNYIGYSRDFPNGDLLNFQWELKKIFNNAFKIIKKNVYSNQLRDRCEGIGILERNDAINAGVTGPCLRASGIDYDIRFEQPYLSYMDRDLVKEWDIVTSCNGDVFSRIEIKTWEMENAFKIINYILTKLIDDISEIDVYDDKNLVLPKEKISIMQVESPQGELVYYLKTSEKGEPDRFAGATICTPSFKNFTALNENILEGNSKSDYSLIIHSMDLNFNEIDL